MILVFVFWFPFVYIFLFCYFWLVCLLCLFSVYIYCVIWYLYMFFLCDLCPSSCMIIVFPLAVCNMFISSCLLLTLDVIFCPLEFSMTLLCFLMYLPRVMYLQRESCLYTRRPRIFAFLDSRSFCLLNVSILHIYILRTLESSMTLLCFLMYLPWVMYLQRESCLYTRRPDSLRSLTQDLSVC